MKQKRSSCTSRRIVCIFTLTLGLGCGSKGAVSLSAHLDHPAVTATSLPLGTSLSGGFELMLELGSVAPEPTEVSLGTFSIKNDAGILVDSLSLTSEQSFPVSIAVGASKSVPIRLDEAELAEPSLATSICTGDIWIVGTVTDSLSGGKPTPVTSLAFAATCPE